MITLTAERLREVLHYDPKTGDFHWLIDASTRVKTGDLAGRINSNGYRQIKFEGISYYAHRLAWLYVHGVFPENITDHRSLTRSDNRIENIRPCTYGENAENRPRRTGAKYLRGAHRLRGRTKWVSYIGTQGGGGCDYLGTFGTEIEAHEAYMREATKRYGEFARAA